MKTNNIIIATLTLLLTLAFFQACQKNIKDDHQTIVKNHSSIDLRGSHDCIPPEYDHWCNPNNWQPFTTTVFLPDYPTCPITVTGLTNHCNARGGYQWIVKDLTFTGPWGSPECHDLISDVFDIIINGTPEEQEAFFNHFYNMLYDEYAKKFVQYLASQYPRETIRCGFSIANPVVEFFVESCYKVCVCGSGAPEDPYTINKNPCGNGCCKRSYEWCLDEDNNLVINQTVTPLSNCTETIPTSCNLLTCEETQCLMWCNL